VVCLVIARRCVVLVTECRLTVCRPAVSRRITTSSSSSSISRWISRRGRWQPSCFRQWASTFSARLEHPHQHRRPQHRARHAIDRHRRRSYSPSLYSFICFSGVNYSQIMLWNLCHLFWLMLRNATKHHLIDMPVNCHVCHVQCWNAIRDNLIIYIYIWHTLTACCSSWWAFWTLCKYWASCKQLTFISEMIKPSVKSSTKLEWLFLNI